MDSVGVQRDGTVGWKNYSWVQKVGRIILVYRRLEELFWVTEGWKNYSGVQTGDSEVLAPRFLMELEGKMDRQLSFYANFTLKLEVLQRPVFSYQCPSPQGLTLTRHYSQYGESIVGQTLFEVPSFVNEIKIRRK